jgi:DNA-binding CsgD family transcriptional regulator
MARIRQERKPPSRQLVKAIHRLFRISSAIRQDFAWADRDSWTLPSTLTRTAHATGSNCPNRKHSPMKAFPYTDDCSGSCGTGNGSGPPFADSSGRTANGQRAEEQLASTELGIAVQVALDALSMGVVVLESTGNIAFANRSAKRLLHQQIWVRTIAGTLRPAEALQDAGELSIALNRLRLGKSTCLLIIDAKSHAQAIVSCSPATKGQGALGLVLIVPTAPPAYSLQSLVLLYALSPAEEQLLRRLLHGDGLSQVAANRCISIHTVRAQLKSLLRKTGRRTQAQLLALATRATALCVEDAAEVPIRSGASGDSSVAQPDAPRSF